MVTFKIVNVVATASLGQKLELGKLKRFKEISHDSKVYGGHVAYFKKANMQGKVSLFTSGKMISIGTTSKFQAYDELKITANFLIQRNFAKPTKLEPRICNVVVKADFARNLNLENLAEGPNVIYEPEQFPAAILRLEKPFKTSILIFASGKIILTGLTNSTQIKPTIAELECFLDSNQK